MAREKPVTRRYINPPAIASPGGRYSHVVQAGGLVFIAGQTAMRPDGQVAGIGDPVAQARQVYANLGAALAAAGGTFADVVKQTIYITDQSYLPAVQQGRGDIWPEGKPPASTVVVCTALALPEFLVEVEAIAVVDEMS